MDWSSEGFHGTGLSRMDPRWDALVFLERHISVWNNDAEILEKNGAKNMEMAVTRYWSFPSGCEARVEEGGVGEGRRRWGMGKWE
jgi:hypothetical protein